MADDPLDSISTENDPTQDGSCFEPSSGEASDTKVRSEELRSQLASAFRARFVTILLIPVVCLTSLTMSWSAGWMRIAADLAIVAVLVAFVILQSKKIARIRTSIAASPELRTQFLVDLEASQSDSDEYCSSCKIKVVPDDDFRCPHCRWPI